VVADFTTPWTLERPETKQIGQQVQIRQLHIALYPTPALVVGYTLGTQNPQGIVEGTTYTKRFTTEDIKALNLPEASGRVGALKSLIHTAYLLLQEGRHIGAGARP